MEITIEIIAFLFVVAIIASTMDTLAGGGGLITIPALMLAGIPPVFALGTNKLQSCVGTGTASLILLRKSKIHWRDIKLLALAAFVGSVIGTLVVQYINPEFLVFVVPIVLLIIAIYFLLYRPSSQEFSNEGRGNKKIFGLLAVPSIGFYDGMFGPGTGSFFALAGVSLRKFPLVVATATAKPLNFATNVSSLIVFAIYGKVLWQVGLIMMLGQFIGASLGVKLLYKINPNHLRKLVVVACLAMLAKYVESSGWLSF